jgi:hypothetical protein
VEDDDGVTVHPFRARPWWAQCAVCGLSAAAHDEMTNGPLQEQAAELNRLPYRCPECVWASEDGLPPAHREGCPRVEEPTTS